MIIATYVRELQLIEIPGLLAALMRKLNFFFSESEKRIRISFIAL